MSVRTKAAAAAAVLALAGGAALTTTPASADASAGVVTGGGGWADDWYDEGTVSASAYSHSNLAAMWQGILWADSVYEQNGTPTDLSDIDCRFGPNTAYSTKRWQGRYKLPKDGKVGPKTFKKAASRVYVSSWNGSTGTFWYEGRTASGKRTGKNVGFRRVTGGSWQMYNQGEWKTVYYRTANFSHCS